MIVYFVTRPHRYTMDVFLYSWGHQVRDRVAVIDYELIPFLARLPAATFVFSDLERLGVASRAMAGAIHDQLRQAGMRVLNDPRESLRRYGLLSALHEAGRNTFRAAWLGEHRSLRLPVFLRDENEHRGNLSVLLRRREDVDRAVAQLRGRGMKTDSVLVVEFCDTADADRVFRKYSAFNVGGRIIPRHLMHGRKWSLKKSDIINEDTAREESVYLATNPHEATLREVFGIARIDYGRIDYSMLGGKLQVWEINTNPLLLEPRKVYSEVRLPAQEVFARAINAELDALAGAAGSAVAVPIAVDADDAEAALAELAATATAGTELSESVRLRRKRRAGARIRG